MADVHLGPGVQIAASAISYATARSGGPGGQHVNTTATKVELRLSLTNIQGMGNRALDRLRELAGDRLASDDTLVLVCDETRSQLRNRILLLERLTQLITEALTIPRPRRATKPTYGSQQRNQRQKQNRSSVKLLRKRVSDE